MLILPQKKLKVLLLGDICTDVYTFGNVTKLNPEAPVPVFVAKRTETKEGMAANVKNNLLALKCTVDFYHGNLSKKTRLVEERSKQQICRIDEDIISQPLDIDFSDNLYDLIIISDYNKGSINDNTILKVVKNTTKPVFIDTKKRNLKQFTNCYFKLNENEYNQLINKNDNIIITCGHKGAIFKDKNYLAKQLEVVDVTGAGDTFLASLAYFYCQYNSMDTAIKYAIIASELTVMHFGVYSPSLEEIYENSYNRI
jgi:bifunctional ADP-heptose synthase (sugar kinase/adenylyltransferase)